MHAIRRIRVILCVVGAALVVSMWSGAGACMAASRLLLSSAVGCPSDSVSLSLFLKNDGESVSEIATDISFDTTTLSYASTSSGAAATAGGKSVSASVSSPGVLSVSVSGSRSTAMSDGVVAVITMNIGSSATTGVHALYQAATASDTSGATVSMEGKPGTVTVGESSANLAVYRFTNKGNGAMFFTTSQAERDWIISDMSNVFTYDGPKFYVSPNQKSGMVKVFRFYNLGNAVHVYTSDQAEADWIMETFSHFNFEGFSYFASPTQGANMVPLYRILDLTTYAHYYTTSATERDSILATEGKQDEGVAYYVYESADPSGSTLVQPSDFTYLGAFRLPDDSGRPLTFEYGGNAMTYYPDGDSSGASDGYPGGLFISGHNRLPYGEMTDGNQVAEVSIPVPVIASSISALNTASFVQSFTDVAYGHFTGMDEIVRQGMEYINDDVGGKKVHMSWGQHFLLDPPVATNGYFNPTLSSNDFQGDWFVGDDGFQTQYGMAGYMFEVPATWADANALGRNVGLGSFRDGGWGGMGPALYCYTPWASGASAPAADSRVAATTLLRYESSQYQNEFTNAMTGYQHPDEWEGGAWLTTSTGKNALIFTGTKGTGAKFWYGWVNPAGTDIPCVEAAFAGDFPVCRISDGGYCPDEDLVECAGHNDYRGWWSSDFTARIILYDPEDMAKVAAGTMDSHSPQPYAYLDIDEHLFLNPDRVEEDMLGTGRQRRHKIGAAAYDRANDLLYVLEQYADGAKPVVHVWRVR